MDTGCFAGNWIFEHIVQNLQLSNHISYHIAAPPGRGLDGKLLLDMGSIELSHITSSDGEPQTGRWFILPTAAGLDAVFGLQHLDMTGRGILRRREKLLGIMGREQGEEYHLLLD